MSTSIWYEELKIPDKVSLSEFLYVARYEFNKFIGEYSLGSYLLKFCIVSLSKKSVIEYKRNHRNIDNLDDIPYIYKYLLFIRRKVKKLRKMLSKVHVVYR